MFIDGNIELATGWTRQTGPEIGGGAPDDYGFAQSIDRIEFWTRGGAYADWLSGNYRPLLPNTGSLDLKFLLRADGAAARWAQCLEFDTRLSFAGWNYNFSSQLVYARRGVLQVSNAAGGWEDTGQMPGLLEAHRWISFHYQYEFDIVKRTGSIRSVEIDGILYEIPVALRNVPAKNLGWKDGAGLQVQLDLGAHGGAFSHQMRNISYEWR